MSSFLETNIQLDAKAKHSWFITIKHLLRFATLDKPANIGFVTLSSNSPFLMKLFKKDRQG